MRYGLIRLDIEDFLTPASDEGLRVMMDQLDRHRLPASYGVVAEKAEALAARGHPDLLDRLRQKPALGFHSLSHSRHPTLAEALAPLDYGEGVAAFMAREGEGVRRLTGRIKAPRYFTQPGGNWVPQAADALPDLGMGIYFSEDWNSYLVPLTEPVWYGRVLHFSLPVVMPAPFLHGLPANLGDAVRLLAEVDRTVPEGGAFCVMTHPTELVTTAFWDAVNFGRGTTRDPLIPAPLRAEAEMQGAFSALDEYWARARALSGIQWVDVIEYTSRIRPRRSVVVGRDDLLDGLSAAGLGPLRLPEGNLSAAEAAWALAWFLRHPGQPTAEVPNLSAPSEWRAAPDRRPGAGERALLDAAAGEILARAALPPRVGPDLPLEDFCAQAWRTLTDRPDADLPLTFLDYIKEPARLHWDWPVFPPDFRPFRLWEEARRLAWSIARVEWRA